MLSIPPLSKLSAIPASDIGNDSIRARPLSYWIKMLVTNSPIPQIPIPSLIQASISHTMIVVGP